MERTEADALDRADMDRLQAGQDAALNDLMERHAGKLFQFLVRMLGNEDDANDVAQETFARVFRARESFRGEAKFTSWLYTIAANQARNQFRWRTRHPSISLDAPQTDDAEQSLGAALPSGAASPDEAATSAERAAAVRRAVSRLPEDMQEALVLCEWEEKSVAEAAEILETTPKAVEARLYRARKTLRKRLAKWL